MHHFCFQSESTWGREETGAVCMVPRDHILLDFKKKISLPDPNSKLMELIQGLSKLTSHFLTRWQEPGTLGEIWCDRERWFVSQFQVGPGSKPGHTGRSLIWMKQIRHMYNLQLVQPCLLTLEGSPTFVMCCCATNQCWIWQLKSANT